MACINCGAVKTIARDLCSGCYYRLKRNGTFIRKNVRNTGLCAEPGCGNQSFAKNLCQHHYNSAQGPLYNTWRLLRGRNPGRYPAEWDQFEAFSKAIGKRPSPKHQLRIIDDSKPLTAGNLRWASPVGAKPQHFTPEQRAAYGREWNLRTRFKITGEEYAAMLAEQGGGCAVCGEKETHRYPSGKLKDLSVDHDHATGDVRGLLCVRCNRAIGYLNDDPDRLRRAAAYLERGGTRRLACAAA